MDETVEPISFGIISEGITDQKVIKHILEGVFGVEGTFINVRFLQPLNDETMQHADHSHGGWTLVSKMLCGETLHEASLFVDFLVIQIDTDVSEEPGFDVPHHGPHGALSSEELCEHVERKLCAWIGDSCDNFLLAVSVHSLECWLLPLLEQKRAKQAKVAGCLEAANKALRQKNEPLLSKGGQKQPFAYAQVSRAYRKKKILNKLHTKNPSLCTFVSRLTALAEQPDVVHRLATLHTQLDEW
jgi:hypothetical protein